HDGTEHIINQGIRYNAVKKKVGMYYSTPVFSFTMTCFDCGNTIVIETDPANFDFRVASGGRFKARPKNWRPQDNAEAIIKDDMMERDDVMGAILKDSKKRSQASALDRLIDEKECLQDDHALARSLRKQFKSRRARREDLYEGLGALKSVAMARNLLD
ncbi:CWC16 protein, partial [Kipferlia bialata]